MTTSPVVCLIELGRTKYEDALALQRQLHAARVAGQIGDLLLLTEHERVLTLGRRADGQYLRVPISALPERGIDLIRTERGGDVTYHGPGQLVAYPILDLHKQSLDVHGHVRRLEQTAILLLQRYGLAGGRRQGAPGVWVGSEKIASVGVYVSRWVTMHGLAINLSPNLADFDLIEPCGLVGTRMTSVGALGRPVPSMAEATRDYATIFAEVFHVSLSSAGPPMTATARAPGPTAPPGHARA